MTPHNERTVGWVRTTKPGFDFSERYPGPIFASSGVRWWSGVPRRDKRFWIRSSNCAAAGRLGELSLVDVRSPINQSGVIFYDTFFDENVVCHIALERLPGRRSGRRIDE